MGSIGNISNSTPTRFNYIQSPDIKDWTDKEEQRGIEMSRYISDKINEGGFYEFYEENPVETIETIPIEGQGVIRDDEITIDKMNLIYAQNWDENDRRVKKGKAVTGSTYYVVQTSDGAIDEEHFAYKTKADAIHAAQLYADRQRQYIDYLKRRQS